MNIMLSASALLMAILVLGAESRPTMEPFMSHAELGAPESVELHSDGSATASRSFHFVDQATGNFTKLDYKVVHTAEVFALRLDLPAADPMQTADAMAVESLECLRGGDVVLHFGKNDTTTASALARLLVAGSLLAGGRHWGCVDDDTGMPTIVLRKITTVVENQKTALRLGTELAHYNHFFKHADIKFHTTRLPARQTAAPENPKDENRNVTSRAESRSRRGFFSFCEEVWDDVKAVGSAVESVVETVKTVVKTAVTGDLDLSKNVNLASTSWNFDTDRSGHWSPDSSKAFEIDGSYTCDHCYFTAKLGLQFDLNIDSYDITLAQVILEGNADARIGFNGEITAKYHSSSKTKVTTLHYGPVIFTIGGIPVSIDMTMPIYAGYKARGEMHGKVDIGGEAHGNVRFGFSYQNGNYGMISDHSLDYNGVLYDAPGDISASLNLYVNPVAVVQVDYIGGPVLGLKAFIEFDGKYATADACSVGGDCDCGPGGMQITSSAGASATIGGSINIGFRGTSLFKKKFPSKGIFNIKRQIAAGCLLGHASPPSPPAPPSPSGGGGNSFVLEDIGTCSSGTTFVDTKEQCATAAGALGLTDTVPGVSTTTSNPYGCYYRKKSSASSRLWWNPSGNKDDDDSDRVSICVKGSHPLPSNPAITEQGCQCKSSWGVNDPNCGDKEFHGCDMVDPCDGDYSHAQEGYPSWCFVEGDCGEGSITAKYDYCNPTASVKLGSTNANATPPVPQTKASRVELIKRASASRFNGHLLKDGAQLQNNGLMTGTVWDGTLEPVPGASKKCYTHDDTGAGVRGNFSMQIIENTNDAVIRLVGASIWATGNSNSLKSTGSNASNALGSPEPIGDSCIAQTGFTMDYYPATRMLNLKLAKGDSDYSACANGAPAVAYGWTGSATKDLSSIQATDSLGCSVVKMSRPRSAGSGPSPPSPPTDADCKDKSEGYFNQPSSCLGTAGCGWCIDHDYNSACCNAKDGQAVLPCSNSYGDVEECSKGWQTDS
jgi:hypothetical protein